MLTEPGAQAAYALTVALEEGDMTRVVSWMNDHEEDYDSFELADVGPALWLDDSLWAGYAHWQASALIQLVYHGVVVSKFRIFQNGCYEGGGRWTTSVTAVEPYSAVLDNVLRRVGLEDFGDLLAEPAPPPTDEGGRYVHTVGGRLWGRYGSVAFAHHARARYGGDIVELDE